MDSRTSGRGSRPLSRVSSISILHSGQAPLSTGIDVDDELTERIADASFQLGQIDGISPTIDFSPVLYTSLVRLEAVETAEIEGADVDVDEVYAHHTRTSRDETVDVNRDLQEVLVRSQY
ncbi:Fic/DOC family N-terminal domain-containing protein [Natrialba taiwanensis]|uniref:Fic/DOC family N-terminal domain-containing protein n=1 Tax=Natrialba taiwanensis TaxID=160846 RepID=UPI000AC30B6F|nr:Fic/DOC family N-terminal domain-containing protein [Natrialba taiwanensis]